MKTFFSNHQLANKKTILGLIENFDKDGQTISHARNTIKIFDVDGKKINIKAFRKPNFINKIVYGKFRKSKARRSFKHANILLSKGIGTPKPIAYCVETGLLFGKSYYISEHIEADLTYRDIIHDTTFPNRHEILKQFTEFTHRLHENGIEFLDHSPGNTLINVRENNHYDFFLVDLNRMKFHKKMSPEKRIKNFSKLTSDKNMVSVMSGVYASLIGKDFETVFTDMWTQTVKFQERFQAKRRWKEKLMPWRK